jgi:hypothetical protein
MAIVSWLDLQPHPPAVIDAIIVSALRLVDNKAILYFDAPTPSDALNWFRGKSVIPCFSM